MCDVLEIDQKSIKKFPCELSFKLLGKRKRLYYNSIKGLKKYSGVMKEIPVPIGRPDFVLESNRRIACIMDAKCKTALETADVQRFLSYILDYMYPTQERLVALIFYLAKEKRIRPTRVKNCEIYLISMTPTSFPYIEDEIRSIIKSTLWA